MARHITVINPWGMSYMDQPALDAASAAVRADTDVEVRNLGEGAAPLPWPLPESAPIAVEAAKQAVADGADALVVGCCADPFLAQIREAVDVPVTSPTEAAIATARSFGKLGILARRFPEVYSPLIPTQDNWDFWNNMARGYGLRDEDYALRRIQVPTHPSPDELNHLTNADPGKLRELTLESMTHALRTNGVEQAQAAANEDGVDVVYFACVFWSHSLEVMGADASTFGVPFLNPVATAASFAEHALIAQGR